MKKRVLALSLVTVLTLSLSACGPEADRTAPTEISGQENSSELSETSEEKTDNIEDSSDVSNEEDPSDVSNENDSSNTSKEETSDNSNDTDSIDTITDGSISFGHSDNTTHSYENKYFGIGLKLDESWAFEEDDDLWYENDLSTEIDASTAIAELEENNTYQDMYAFNSQKYSYITAFQRMDEETKTGTIDDYFSLLEEELTPMLESDETHIVSMSRAKAPIDGKEFPALRYTVSANDMTYHIIQFPIMKGDFLLTVTVTTNGDEMPYALLDALYLLED